MISFRSDYEEGACPEVLRRLVETNEESTPGYGEDPYCRRAAEKIRLLCECPDAAVFFMAGGTSTNALTLAHLLRPYEAAVSADTGHIQVHETGAVEASGHKVIACRGEDGKLTPGAVREVVQAHTDCHMVRPALVYISQPTEMGTLYSLEELEALHALCRERHLLLYLDGARLASALTAQGNDVFLPDLARLCDAFYIGGTKCGALFGEALVFPDPEKAVDFAYTRKQRGGLLAKGRLLGVQFEALMEGGRYEKIGKWENETADRLREGIRAAGYGFFCETRTNQIFPILPETVIERLEKEFAFHRQNRIDEEHQVIRLVTSWHTKTEDAEAFLQALRK